MSINGQIVLEYAIIIGLVVAIMLAMMPRIKRLLQGMIRVTADQIGNQKEADQFHSYSSNSAVDSHTPDLGDGYLVTSYSYTRADNNKRTLEAPNISDLGNTMYVFKDNVYSNSASVSNLGFAPEKF